MNLLCPLCKSFYISVVEKIDAHRLCCAYYNNFNIDFKFSTDIISYCKCENCKLLFFTPSVVADKCFYEKLQDNNWYYLSEKYEYNFASKYINKDHSVLEVGSGPAFFAKQISSKRYVGLEFNDKAIERAKQNNVTLIKQSVEDYARQTQEIFDVIVSFQVLEHVSEPAAFIEGCLFALRPGGKLILSVPSVEGCFGEAVNHLLDMPPHHQTRWTYDALVSIADIYDLTIKEIEYEPIAIYHQRVISRMLWEKKLRKLTLKKRLIFDYSFSGRLLGKIANALASISSINPRKLKGHTVIAVYEKG
jgi:SAM-dependent methyltransferase